MNNKRKSLKNKQIIINEIQYLGNLVNECDIRQCASSCTTRGRVVGAAKQHKQFEVRVTVRSFRQSDDGEKQREWSEFEKIKHEQTRET